MKQHAFKIDFSGALKRLGEEQAKHVVASAAEILRSEIVNQMEPGPPRTGHEYPMPDTPGTTYTASAPGEPPAVRIGDYAGAWQTSPTVVSGTEVVALVTNDRKTEDEQHFIAEILEYGTNDILTYGVKMSPRPHIRPATDVAQQRVDDLIRNLSS